ncbi:GNAT family N-acetyltransferase [Nakamurella aerolata]|uniref:GNAT family N-acetyltransferase n=1 Tax=Nakamurella aerolata TaxID=1656892 RepID=A0A849AJ75_9ACTN|nr:GNAT family N-acetyltransferase [Nakamurella aerolata]NNG36862.1 GNAT family N-acetyltransferase [Nakamurella aerolata]
MTDTVRLRRVDPDEVSGIAEQQTAQPWGHWINKPDTDHFGIDVAGRVVGQIVLHDINLANGEALIAYHVFAASDRRRGYATRALARLVELATERGDLRRLVIITSADNAASQALARRGGFRYVGAPREDPTGLVFERQLSRGTRAGDER